MDDGDRLFWIIILVFFAFAAYFAIAETSFASANKVRVKALAERGNRRAARAIRVLDNFDYAVTTILIGTNITHLGIASLVTVLVIRTWGDAYVTLSTLITTIVVFFLSEMLPKSVAKRYPESLALVTATSLLLFMKLFYPASFVLTKIGQGVSRLVGEVPEVTVTEEELHDIIEDMTDDGTLDEEKSELLSSALDFGDLTVEAILTPRADSEMISLKATPEEIIAFLLSHSHSRYPVYRCSPDRIVGVLRLRKYLKAYRTNSNLRLAEVMDKPLIATRGESVSDLIDRMNHHKRSMAIVVDEHGRFCGVATIKDALEGLVGSTYGGEMV